MPDILVAKFVIRSTYGNELIYPDNDIARKFLCLTKTKTFSKQDIETIKALGFRVSFPQHLV